MVVSSLSGQHYSQKTPDHLLEDENENDNHIQYGDQGGATYFVESIRRKMFRRNGHSTK